jgi:hypothetical protein
MAPWIDQPRGASSPIRNRSAEPAVAPSGHAILECVLDGLIEVHFPAYRIGIC